MRAAGQRYGCARVAPGGWWDASSSVPAGDLDGFGGELGEDLRKPPTDASPSAEIEFTLSKKWYLPCPPRWGAGVCNGPASKKRIVRQPLSAATTCGGLRGNVQAIFIAFLNKEAPPCRLGRHGGAS